MAGKSQPSAKLTLPLPADVSPGRPGLNVALSLRREVGLLEAGQTGIGNPVTHRPGDPATRRPVASAMP